MGALESHRHSHRDSKMSNYRLDHCHQKRVDLQHLRDELERYLSDENLNRDPVFQELVLSDPDGWIPFDKLLECHKIKRIGAYDEDIRACLKGSDKLEAMGEGDDAACLRRVHPYVMSNDVRRTCDLPSCPEPSTRATTVAQSRYTATQGRISESTYTPAMHHHQPNNWNPPGCRSVVSTERSYAQHTEGPESCNRAYGRKGGREKGGHMVDGPKGGKKGAYAAGDAQSRAGRCTEGGESCGGDEIYKGKNSKGGGGHAGRENDGVRDKRAANAGAAEYAQPSGQDGNGKSGFEGFVAYEHKNEKNTYYAHNTAAHLPVELESQEINYGGAQQGEYGYHGNEWKEETATNKWKEEKAANNWKEEKAANNWKEEKATNNWKEEKATNNWTQVKQYGEETTRNFQQQQKESSNYLKAPEKNCAQPASVASTTEELEQEQYDQYDYDAEPHSLVVGKTYTARGAWNQYGEEGEDYLIIKEGECVKLLQMTEGWADCESKNGRGYYPPDYLE